MALMIGTQAVTLSGAWWARGSNLAERVDGPVAVPGEADDRQRRRLERWRSAHGMAPEVFARRLADAGLTEDGLLALLRETPEGIAGRVARPAWAAEVVEALAASTPDAGAAADATDQSAFAGFAAIVAPFARRAVRRIAAAGPVAHTDSPALTVELGDRLLRTLVQIASRTLVLELNVLRVTDRLRGDTPHERFASFVRHFRKPAHLAALVEEYPVLARLLVQAAERAVDGHLELLDRYARDRPTLVARLFGNVDPGPLVSVVASGDGHRGRAVAVLRFAGGARVVYKPRPLAVHRHFNAVLGWLNGRLPGLNLRQLRVVERDGYGWVEFARQRSCCNAAAVRRYYRRQGALLALLYVLDGADFHFENLIACGDQPVLVDLEALLHPQVRVTGPDWMANDPALLALAASVDRIGLLPRLTIGADGAVDLSGLGGDKGAPLPGKQAAWADVGTDAMSLTRAQTVLSGGQNRPRIVDADTDVDPAMYAGDLLGGFTDAYEAIAAHREELVGDGGLLWRFADDEIRVIMRGTRMYAQLLDESTHPDVLRDALDRDRILDYLWAASAGEPVRERLFRPEVADLWAGDVPIFTCRPGSSDVWTGSGVRLSGLLSEPSLSRAETKIRSLGADDLARQTWVIRAAFAARALPPGPDVALRRGHSVAEPDRVGWDADRLVAAAGVVAAEIERSACSDGSRVNWLGLDLVEQKYWTLAPLGADLFGGYPGVALFLAQLAAVTGEERYADLARRAVASVPDAVAGMGQRSVGLGGFSGAAGLAYALVHLASLLDEPAVAAPVEVIVERCRATLVADDVPDPFDVVAGSAGTLAAVLSVYAATGLDAARVVADLCAERLVARAVPTGPDAGLVGWPSAVGEGVYLAGFSHGLAGTGWALARYAAVTGEARCLELSGKAFAHERRLYDAELGDWLDLRPASPGTPERRRMHAWCNGAPGIGLGRADVLRLFPDAPGVAGDLELAVGSVVVTGALSNHSLCHGELGNLELLTAAAGPGNVGLGAGVVWTEERSDEGRRRHKGPEARASGASVSITAAGHRARRTADALARIERGAVRCGTPGAIGTPGLLTGYAGIGHGLLRLAHPDRVPAVLLLDPPVPS